MRRLLQALLGRRRYHDRWARIAAAAESAADDATAALDLRRGPPPVPAPAANGRAAAIRATTG